MPEIVRAMRAIEPINQLDTRMPRAGKIRLGAKTGNAMKKLTEFRFMSPFEDCIQALAAKYGGTCKPLHDDRASPKDQFEVFTDASQIDVYLIPEGYSTWYEWWKAGGLQRRCDGEFVDVPTAAGPNGEYEMISCPCLCMSEGVRSCDVKTRLVVILPDVPMRGAWLLETKSFNAAVEVPGMHKMITQLSPGGMVRAQLGIEQREKMVLGKKRSYVVPTLTMPETAMELQAGLAGVRAISASRLAEIGSGAVATPALPAGTPVVVRPATVDDEIADAELIDDEWEEIEAGLRNDAEQFSLDETRFLAAIHSQIAKDSKGNEVDDDERKRRAREARRKMGDGELEPVGFKADGSVQWLKK